MNDSDLLGDGTTEPMISRENIIPFELVCYVKNVAGNFSLFLSVQSGPFRPLLLVAKITHIDRFRPVL